MNNKVLFMILGNSVQYLENSTMDHREWYESLGYDNKYFDTIIRGYVMDNKIVFFKGPNFNYDDSVIKAACAYGPRIRQHLNNPTLEVCCGILISSYGAKWEPIVRLKESDLTGVLPSKEEKTIVDYGKVETGPIIEFKNDIEDEVFIKRATIVTGIVLGFNILIKGILFFENKALHITNILDILLSISQIGLLAYCIYGYRKKNPSTKYLALIASVLMILVLDIWDVILGILYFVFSVDQSYFTNAWEKVKSLKKEKTENKNS